MDERFEKTKANKQTTKKPHNTYTNRKRAAEVMVELQRLHDLIHSKVGIFYMEAEWRDVETTQNR